MSDYFLAPSLAVLRDDLNREFPHRDKASDGWIGDARHQAELYSDHNPCWGCAGKLSGVVRALDIDNDGWPGEITPLVKAVLRAAIGDARVWYVIWNRKIYSRTYGWQARAYTGSDPHTNHVHLSIQGHNLSSESGPAAVEAAFSTAHWLGAEPKPVPTLPTLKLVNAWDAYRHPHQAVHPVAVKRIQRALNAHGARLRVDGVYGPSTRVAVRRFKGPHATDGHPGLHVMTELSKGRFRLIR